MLARQTGLGSAFLGATLLALATSLPEVSTTTAAARHKRYNMAISNVFGSNAFDVSLLFVADLLYCGDTILGREEHSLVFVAAIGAIQLYCCAGGKRLSSGWNSIYRVCLPPFSVWNSPAQAPIPYQPLVIVSVGDDGKCLANYMPMERSFTAPAIR